MSQLWRRDSIIDVASRKLEGQEPVLIIDDSVKLEAVEPADRRFAPVDAGCLEHPMDMGTLGMTDAQAGEVDEGNAGHPSAVGVHQGTQRHQSA